LAIEINILEKKLTARADISIQYFKVCKFYPFGVSTEQMQNSLFFFKKNLSILLQRNFDKN